MIAENSSFIEHKSILKIIDELNSPASEGSCARVGDFVRERF